MVLSEITQEETVQQLRSYFLASITQEFRTPLSALNASVEFLLDEVENLSKEETRDLLRSIHMSVTGLQTLIENLLESINIEAGHFTVKPQVIDIDEVVMGALCIMRPLLDRRQQQIVVNKLTALPKIQADPTHLQQALVNLLSNASKYGPMEDQIDLILERTSNDSLRVAVADRGSGIPLADKEKLFHRFVRLDTEDGTQYGVGLGLSVVKAIIQEHNGEVGMEDRPGGGSIFWFTVPLTGNTR